MNALAFLEKHGKDVATRVAERAGTNWAYFSQIAYGHRRPSTDLAHRLVDSSELEFPKSTKDQLDLAGLLPPKKKAA